MTEEKVLGPTESDATEVATPEEAQELQPVEEVAEPKKRASKKKKEEPVEEPEELQAVEAGAKNCEVVEVTPPPIEPMDNRPFAEINGKKYYIDSDNSDLLEDVAGGKVKNAAGQWEEQTFKYLPAKHIYTLMDALFDTYDFKSEPVKYTGEEYQVTKKKFNNQTKKWEDVQETVRVYEKTVRIITTVRIDEYQTVVRETIGYAQAVAGFGILTNDSARNGFANKLAFRARKEALKNLGKVFRTYDYEDENEFVAEETTSVAGKALADVAAATEPVADNEAQEWREAIVKMLNTIKDFFATGAEFTEDEMTKAMFAVKSDLGITAEKKVAMDEFKKIYNDLKARAKK